MLYFRRKPRLRQPSRAFIAAGVEALANESGVGPLLGLT